MNDETLNKANRIRKEITDTENMVRYVAKEAVIEMSFNNGGYDRWSCQSKYLSAEEVATIKANITEQIRLRAQARLHELQKEFNNL